MKILINVVNARNVGGGLQVVHNFLLGTLTNTEARMQTGFRAVYPEIQHLQESHFPHSNPERCRETM